MIYLRLEECLAQKKASYPWYCDNALPGVYVYFYTSLAEAQPSPHHTAYTENAADL